MKGRSFFVSIWSLLVFLGIIGLAVTDVVAGDKPIVVGNIADLTGGTAAVGVPTANGQQDYFNYLNEKGGVCGYKIKSICLDGGESITAETRQFNRLVTREKAVAIIGWSTPGTRALMPAATRAGVTFLGRTCSRVAINPGKFPYTFIPTPTYLDQNMIALEYVKSQGAKNVVIVRDDLEAWKTTIEILLDSKYAEKIGLNIMKVVVEPIKATDVTVQMLRVKELNPDFVLCPNTADTMMPTLRDGAKVGIDPKTIIASTIWGVHQVIAQKLKNLAEGYMGVQVYPIWGGDNDIQKEIDEWGQRNPGKIKKFKGSSFYIQGWMLGKAFAVTLEKVLKNNNGKAPKDLQDFRKQFRDVYFGLKGPIFGKGLPAVDNSDHKLIDHAYLVRLQGDKYVMASEYIKVK